MRYTSVILLSLILFLTMTATALTDKASVLMMEKCLITGSEIRLGDMAVIKTADETLKDKLREIQIAPAAKPGFSQKLHVGYVKSRVRQDGDIADSITWSGSQFTVAETRALRISPQEFTSRAEKFILDKINAQQKQHDVKDEASSIQIMPVSQIQPALLPYGGVDIRVEPAIPVESCYLHWPNGIAPLRFTISVDGQEQEKRVIHFKVSIFREVMLADHTLDRHRIIEEGDLRPAVRDVGKSSAHASVFFQKDDLIGKRCKRMIPAGAIIIGKMVETPPIVNHGDLVTIVIESRAFRITAQGKAMEDGVRGQIIKVTNTLSMKTINAQVVNEKLVQVAF